MILFTLMQSIFDLTLNLRARFYWLTKRIEADVNLKLNILPIPLKDIANYFIILIHIAKYLMDI